MVERVTQEHGRIDVLVNNAAGNFYAPSATLSPNAWRAVVETDLYGTFYCSQAVHGVMKAQGGGRIVSISMTLHYRGWPFMAHATAAKAGVDALTRTHGNVAEVSRLLGIGRTTLYAKMKKYGLR